MNCFDKIDVMSYVYASFFLWGFKKGKRRKSKPSESAADLTFGWMLPRSQKWNASVFL